MNLKNNVENNKEKYYNEVGYNVISYIILDERKIKFMHYSSAESFLKLNYERMNKAIAVGSKYVLEAQQQNYDSYSFNDEKYIYDFDIIDKNNNSFRIINVYEIGDDYNDITVKTKIRRNSKYSLDDSKH